MGKGFYGALGLRKSLDGSRSGSDIGSVYGNKAAWMGKAFYVVFWLSGRARV